MIRILISELGEAECEGVLRSISSDLGADTPVSRTLELRAGEKVADRLQGMGTLPVGAAVITPAGDLPAGFLIHAVLQSREEPVRTGTIRSALTNGLRRAQEWGLASLALPPLGMGAGNLEAEDSAQAMIPVLLEHLQRGDPPREIVIAVTSTYEEDVFLRAVELAQRHPSAQEH